MMSSIVCDAIMPWHIIQFNAYPVESYLNTQTHLFLASALLCQPATVGVTSQLSGKRLVSANKMVNIAVLMGAIAPDMSLFIMFGQAKIRGIADEVIWKDLYYSHFWQEAGAVTNSVPVYSSVAIIGLLLGGRLSINQTSCSDRVVTGYSLPGKLMLYFSIAALLHCITDLPLHFDDGHAHFWPFSDWIFRSPVSYWDSNHYALYWQPIELLIGLVCIVLLWRRFTLVWIRAAVVLGFLSYGALAVFWSISMS